MQKKFLNIFIMLLFVMLFSGCMTIQSSVNIPEKEDNDVSIKITKIIQKKGYGLWFLCVPLTTTNTQGVEVVITNNTNEPISINWNKSSFNWRNTSSPVITGDSKFIQAGTNTIPNTSIGSNKTAKIKLFPANNVEWTGKKWKINGMNLKKGDILSLITYMESGKSIETTYEVEREDGIHFIK